MNNVDVVVNIDQNTNDRQDVVLRKVHLDSDLSKNSKEILRNISNDLKVVFRAEGINAKVEEGHHITYAYFTEITSHDLWDIIADLYSLKKEIQGLQMLNKDIDYDQSFHQTEIRSSNVTGDTHVVLTPHNPESIYKNLIVSKNISPHINVAKINIDPTKRDDVKRKVKNIVKSYIQNDGIYWDLSKIHIHI